LTAFSSAVPSSVAISDRCDARWIFIRGRAIDEGSAGNAGRKSELLGHRLIRIGKSFSRLPGSFQSVDAYRPRTIWLRNNLQLKNRVAGQNGDA